MRLLLLTLVLILLSSACMTNDPTHPQKDAAKNLMITPTIEAQTPDVKTDQDEFREALADIWVDQDEYSGDGFSISRQCEYSSWEAGRGNCELLLRDRGTTKRLYSVSDSSKEQFKFGFLDMLGKGEKQLLIFSYSGGAHCCYDYSIYDLKPKLRIVYDSSKYDSVNEIGNELEPVDIDHDGVMEFRRDVMAFDYVGAGGHAGATFPPAIFRYDNTSAKYVLATKKFAEFVMDDLEHLITKEKSRSESEEDLYRDEYLVRTRFLYMIYAGHQSEAWKYFDENYRSKTGDGYQEQFKDQFKREFKELFAKDPTYRSIYP